MLQQRRYKSGRRAVDPERRDARVVAKQGGGIGQGRAVTQVHLVTTAETDPGGGSGTAKQRRQTPGFPEVRQGFDREHVCAAVVQNRKALFDRYSKVIAAWEKKAGDAEKIAEYRAYRSAIIIEETRTADTETLVAEAISWLVSRDGGIELGREIAVIVIHRFFQYKESSTDKKNAPDKKPNNGPRLPLK